MENKENSCHRFAVPSDVRSFEDIIPNMLRNPNYSANNDEEDSKPRSWVPLPQKPPLKPKQLEMLKSRIFNDRSKKIRTLSLTSSSDSTSSQASSTSERRHTKSASSFSQSEQDPIGDLVALKK